LLSTQQERTKLHWDNIAQGQYLRSPSIYGLGIVTMIMSDVKLGYNMLTGFYGFSIIVYGFYLNHRNANPKHKDGSGTGGSESGGNSGGGGDAGDTKEAIRIGVDGVVGGDV